LYQWIKRCSLPEAGRTDVRGHEDEIRRLKSELKHVAEERNILQKGQRRVLGGPVRAPHDRVVPYKAKEVMPPFCGQRPLIFYANENRKLPSSFSRIIMAAAFAGGGFYLCPVRGCGLLIIPCRVTGNIQDPD
jgi:hypothetical protein